MSFEDRLKRVSNITLGILASLWMLVQLYFTFVQPMHPMTLSPIFLCFALAIVFINKPFPGSGKYPWLRVIDFLTFPVFGWVIWYSFVEQLRIISRIPYIEPVLGADKVAMFIIMVLLLEAVRRVIGMNLLIFVMVFIAYCFLGKYCPGFTKFSGFNLKQFTEIMTLTSQGIYGTPLSTTASYIFYFMIFGSLFAACGGGQVLIDIGMKFSNPKTGGPAKAAVLSSGLMGMISGSAVANVSTTGVMTIPMMKKAGYTPEQAGAIESVASTGGQIMPPIMGVGAFIMAELLGVQYGQIALSAAIPAIAYFASVFLLVGFLARANTWKHIGTDVSADELTFKVNPILGRLYLLLPALVLVYMVLTGKSLRSSALVATVIILVLNIFNKNRLNLKELFEAFIDGIKQCANVAVPVAACGIIIGTVVQSGLANKFSGVIATVGGSSLLLALLITMLGCMLLGMALPTVAAYLIAVVLFVPVLVKLGLPLLVCHMFCFYFGVMAQITPPVCLASFTAAGIAGADSWKTGWTGFIYASVAFIVPFVFAYEPAVLLQGPVINTVTSSVTLFLGVYALAASIAGFMFAPLNKVTRALLLGCAFLSIVPETVTDVIGIALLAVIVYGNYRQAKAHAATEQNAV